MLGRRYLQKTSNLVEKLASLARGDRQSWSKLIKDTKLYGATAVVFGYCALIAACAPQKNSEVYDPAIAKQHIIQRAEQTATFINGARETYLLGLEKAIISFREGIDDGSLSESEQENIYTGLITAKEFFDTFKRIYKENFETECPEKFPKWAGWLSNILKYNLKDFDAGVPELERQYNRFCQLYGFQRELTVERIQSEDEESSRELFKYLVAALIFPVYFLARYSGWKGKV